MTPEEFISLKGTKHDPEKEMTVTARDLAIIFAAGVSQGQARAYKDLGDISGLMTSWIKSKEKESQDCHELMMKTAKQK